MKDTKTPFTDVNGITPMSVYLDAENALSPLDDIIAVLLHAYADFNLGDVELDVYGKSHLLDDRHALGSMIMLAADALEKVQEDFRAVNPKKKEKAQTQSNPESAN